MRHNHPDFKKAQTTIEFLLGPIKIKDGLFLGDQLAAKDIEFIITNKVTHIINTVSKVVPNLYERFGVQYLSVHWTQKQQNIFDKKNNAVNAIFSFIEQAMEQGESVLIHSLHGKSRACAVMAAYLMKKFNWNLNKTLQLINSKKEGLQIRNNYLVQMQELQKRMRQNSKLSASWEEIKNQEDLLMANTYLNAKKTQPVMVTPKKNPKKKLTWDQKLVNKGQPMGSTFNKFKDSTLKKQEKRSTSGLKSILKGFPNEDYQEQQPVQKQFNLDGGQQKLINNINGNIVHVTVNNFITTEKKPETQPKMYNARPYSSDTKDREKKANPYDPKPNKLFGYDTFTTNLKSAYEQKVMGKVGTAPPKGVSSAYGTRTGKKKEETKGFMANDRPSSANNEQTKKPKPTTFNSMFGRDEMMVTGSSSSGTAGKKRFPSSNPKQEGYRFK